jgi:hypothetical protein
MQLLHMFMADVAAADRKAVVGSQLRYLFADSWLAAQCVGGTCEQKVTRVLALLSSKTRERSKCMRRRLEQV